MFIDRGMEEKDLVHIYTQWSITQQYKKGKKTKKNKQKKVCAICRDVEMLLFTD